MPYEIRKEGNKWCVYKKSTEEKRGCSDSEKMAKEHMKALYAHEKSAYAQFSMRIVNAFVPESGRRDRKMRLNMVTSDTGEDAYEERMSVELYNDFKRRIDENLPVPEPFNEVICEDGWCGGLPYPSISHYRSGAGKNVPGEIEKVYVDGELLKADAFLDETPLGLAVWSAVCDDLEERKKPLEERAHENPVRVSIGFLDLQHKHELDNGSYIFTRSSLKQTCPKCDEGINGKVYLQGQLVHLAFTRVPANPRTSVEVMKMDEEILTKKDDAKSIIGEELAETLIGKSTADEVLVVKSELEKESQGIPEIISEEVMEKTVLAVKEKADHMEDCPDGDEECMKKMKKEKEMQKSAVAVVEPMKSKVDVAIETFKSKLTELKSTGVTGDNALKELQPFFNELGKVTKEEVSNPLEISAEVTRSVVREELQALVPDIVAQIMKALPTGGVAPQTAVNVPQPRSLLLQRSAPDTTELTQIQRLARQTTIGQ